MSVLHLPAGTYPALPPVAVNDDAMQRFIVEMDRRLAEFDERFFQRRLHPRIDVARHLEQTPRKPR